MRIFIVALFVIAPNWKQPRCPSTSEWQTISGASSIQWNTPSNAKKQAIDTVTTWSDLKEVILSEKANIKRLHSI